MTTPLECKYLKDSCCINVELVDQYYTNMNVIDRNMMIPCPFQSSKNRELYCRCYNALSTVKRYLIRTPRVGNKFHDLFQFNTLQEAQDCLNEFKIIEFDYELDDDNDSNETVASKNALKTYKECPNCGSTNIHAYIPGPDDGQAYWPKIQCNHCNRTFDGRIRV